MTEEEIIDVIVERRMSLGMSQVELGKKTGLSQAFISKMEHMVNIPTIETLNKILPVLDLELKVCLKEVTIVDIIKDK